MWHPTTNLANNYWSANSNRNTALVHSVPDITSETDTSLKVSLTYDCMKLWTRQKLVTDCLRYQLNCVQDDTEIHIHTSCWTLRFCLTRVFPQTSQVRSGTPILGARLIKVSLSSAFTHSGKDCSVNNALIQQLGCNSFRQRDSTHNSDNDALVQHLGSNSLTNTFCK